MEKKHYANIIYILWIYGVIKVVTILAGSNCENRFCHIGLKYLHSFT